VRNKQQTLRKIYSFGGVGLHSGKYVNIRIIPAEENFGVKIVRSDLSDSPLIEAIADYVVFTERGTVLEKNGIRVSTVEHLLSAFAGFGVDNALIEVDGPEFPILDGSSLPYSNAIASDGLLIQRADRKYYKIEKEIYIKDEKTGSEIKIEPFDYLSIDVKIDFKSNVLGVQSVSYDASVDYLKEIAPARTFVFFHEIGKLVKSNLIKGGDLDNAIIVSESRVEENEVAKLSKLLGKELSGPINPGYVNIDTPLFTNEFARHKLLDLLGDLYLSGVWIKGKITAFKPGHKINIEISKIIREMTNENLKEKEIPRFDPNAEPVVDINGIKKLLPHRPPFLMVDRIISMSGHEVVGIKTIGINEGYFVGHFPDEPVMPGVLIIEAMAQVGGILVLSELDEPEKYSTYFAKINGAKFKRKVVPGDILIIKLSLTSPLRRSIVGMKGEVYVGNTLACEADLVAQVIKNK